MKKLEYRATFTTPAFLGNADQDGQWRTPPFKALLRQWWRVSYAADHGFQVDLAAMRREEGLLFGNAWLSHPEGHRTVADFRKSLVRLRLDRWDTGRLTRWPGPDNGVTHPEVRNRDGRAVAVGSQLYLGYGPLVFRNRETSLKANAAVQVAEGAAFSLAAPDDAAPRIERALALMHRYGTLGGRSRNGWGSLTLEPLGGTPPLTGGVPLRPWRQALGLDWPHALGEDEHGPLIWQTGPFDDWKQLMRELARIKIGLRTQCHFTTGRNAQHPEARHWLSHPVTNHNVQAWGQARLPNSLRFKVRQAPGQPKKVVGVIFHVPCLPPLDFQPNARAIADVWQGVHAFLDAPAQKLSRIQE